MLALARWCTAHGRRVVVGWVLLAIVVTVCAQVFGASYASVYSLPGTGSQRAHDLLERDFPAQSGDVDEIVFQVARGTIDAPVVRGTITSLLSRVAKQAHVVAVLSPYEARGAEQVSANRQTAFAQVNYDKSANALPTATGEPLINAVKAVHAPGLEVAAGGAVVEAAEGFNVGPATEVGVLAALLILLITFGSVTAAGMPMITAGIALIAAVAAIELATHVTAMPNVSTDLALMIGLGVGIDYALFIVTRFRESYLAGGDVERAVIEAMDTAGRAILLAGSTVIIALLGMFATGVEFMYGLAIAAVIAVLLTLLASLTLLPALLARFGPRLARRHLFSRRRDALAAQAPESHAGWRRWSSFVQAHPRWLALLASLVMVGLLLPVSAMRLDASDAGNDASNLTSRHAFDLLADGFGAGFNGPLLLVAELPRAAAASSLPGLEALVSRVPGVVTVTQPRIAPAGSVAVIEVYPRSAPEALATAKLVDHLREDVLPAYEHSSGVRVDVGGFTAGSIDFSNVLASKLPLFFSIVIVLSALLLFVMFRSLLIPIQAAIMNVLTIGAALGITVAVFQDGIGASLLAVQKGPIEAWIPVLLFAVVFGLSMDYEVFIVSRIREQWLRRHDASAAVGDGLALTGRVVTAAAAIMVCVFLSFTLSDERTLKEFGFGLAVAVALDALVVRCLLLPAVLELLGPRTWRLPRLFDAALPRINVEGSAARAAVQARARAGTSSAER